MIYSRAFSFAVLGVLFASTALAAPFAYIKSGNSKVLVVDIATNTVTATIPVANGNYGGAVTPSGARFLATDYFVPSVPVIDTSTNTVTATITGFSNPISVAFNPSETRAYVVDYGAVALRVVDLSTNSIIATIPVQPNPWGVAVNPAGTRAYVTNQASGTVSVVDLSTDTVLTTITTGGTHPIGVAVSPDGSRVYVANFINGSLTVINAATDTVVTNITNGGSFGVAVNADGSRVYTTDGGNTVRAIDTSTNTVSATISVGTGAYGLALTPDGTRLYVQSDAANTISVINTATNAVVTTIAPPDGVNQYSLGMFIGPMCPSGCSDGNVCTGDTCNMVSGCSNAPAAGSCDDGEFCNGVDTCSGGSCVHPGNPCTGGGECSDACNETADNCFEPVGTPCTSDSNVCTDDECDAVGVCAYTANSASCDDGLFCNGTDTCSASACGHSGDPCDGGPECADTCDEDDDTCNVSAGDPCTPDANACTDDECDGFGDCTHPANSAPCDDGLFCNGVDTCSGGSCGHSGDPCDGGPECADTCDEDDDTCNVPDGTACDDAVECTVDDQCTAGTCSGDSMTCGDAVVQAGCSEDCDDGALLMDDGCDATCHFEPCRPSPRAGCKSPYDAGKSSVKIRNDADDARDSLQWRWSKGSQTDMAELGDPTATDDYWLCVYDNGSLLSTTRVPAGGTCDGDPCWTEKKSGFDLKAKTPTADGATGLKLGAGSDGKAKAQLKGKGAGLDLPDTSSVGGPLVVQLVRPAGGNCWTTTFAAPFAKQDEERLSDKDD